MSIEEVAAAAKTELSAVLSSAIETISNDQTIKFSLYVKMVLPLDGCVFWVNASLLADGPVTGVSRFALKEKITVAGESVQWGAESLPKSRTVRGSLHRQVASQQTDVSTQSLNHVIFTPMEQVDNFNASMPGYMYVGEIEGIQFSFSRMANKYLQAGIFHYRGDSIYPVMRSQMIQRTEDLDQSALILSNSMPIWMKMSTVGRVYPSFLVEPDLPPPYVVIDIKETKVLQSAPSYGAGQRAQHVQDSARVTLFGFNNAQAITFVDRIVQTAVDFEEYGITNSPVIFDDKMNQVEISALAKRKRIDFDINYYQSTALDMARQLIKTVFITYEIN